MTRGWLCRAHSDQRGTGIVEMALVLPILLLLVVGTLDFGRAIYVRNALANAARDGARIGVVDPSNTSCIRTVAARRSSLAELTAADVTVTPPGTIAVGQPITVEVNSTYHPLSAMVTEAFGLTTLKLRASATMQIRNVPSSSLACPS